MEIEFSLSERLLYNLIVVCVLILGLLDATKAAFCAVCPEEDGGSWMKKSISFGADGSSINMGHHGGVEAGRHIIPIHCMPHKFVINENSCSMIYLYLLA